MHSAGRGHRHTIHHRRTILRREERKYRTATTSVSLTITTESSSWLHYRFRYSSMFVVDRLCQSISGREGRMTEACFGLDEAQHVHQRQSVKETKRIGMLYIAWVGTKQASF